MYVVAAQYYAQAGKEQEISEILKKMIPITRAEPGCAMYVVNQSTEDPRKFLLYEQYYEKAGFDAHIASEPFQENILGKVVPMLERRERAIYQLL